MHCYNFNWVIDSDIEEIAVMVTRWKEVIWIMVTILNNFVEHSEIIVIINNLLNYNFK